MRKLWQRLRFNVKRRLIERKTRAELHALDGRTLHDLGLDRGQIPWIARAASEQHDDPLLTFVRRLGGRR